VTRFSIIIPVYNEALNIKKLISEIYQTLGEPKEYEIIIVDDWSQDSTVKIVKSFQNEFFVNLIKHKKNLGQSNSILSGIKNSKNKIIVTIDGDGQNNPNDIPVLLEKYILLKDFSLIGGIRKNRKDNLIKIISSKIANLIRSKILNDNCKDTGCSLKIFDKNVFLKLPFFDGMHRFLPALFKGFGYRTYFMDVDHRPRLLGYSKYGTFDRLFRGIRDLIRVMVIINKYKND